MKFRTIIPTSSYPFNITHDHSIMLMGSCFSDHIGHFFQRSGFSTCSNSFGTLFNPISIAQDIELLLYPENWNENWIDYYDNQWISFAHYTKFSHSDKELFLQRIRQQLKEGSDFLRNADFLFLTWGTAFCYRLLERNLIVANCHKMPASMFQRNRLSIDEIVERYRLLFNHLQQVNPKLKVVFTISPIRHLSDGFHENTLSKSTLHLAAEELLDQKNIFYFPAYEILNDDLRDYRFYDADLTHPGSNAVEYIQELFSQSFFTPCTQEICRLKEKEYKAAHHQAIK